MNADAVASEKPKNYAATVPGVPLFQTEFAPISRALRFLLVTAFITYACPAARGDGVNSDAIRREQNYTITTVMRLLKPADVRWMNDDFQSARQIASDGDSITVEITYYPLIPPPDLGEDRDWRVHDAADSALAPYLRPTATENWDQAIRDDLLIQLAAYGIHVEQLSDRELVQRVSQWALVRSQHVEAFINWLVDFRDGQAFVPAELRPQFTEETSSLHQSDTWLMDHVLFGRQMYFNHSHADCTSSATYLCTIFRALGIPSRIIFMVPAADINDRSQIKLLLDNIHQNHIRHIVASGLTASSPSNSQPLFANHLFNEVYVNGHWRRLNYSRLDQPIVDSFYLGLQTHIFTTADLSQAHLAQTWGRRYALYPSVGPKLSSINPYMLLSASDHFGSHADIPNPPEPDELTGATIDSLVSAGTPPPGLHPARSSDVLIGIKEWLPYENYVQLRQFYSHCGHHFALRADGHADVRAKLDGMNYGNSADHFHGFGLHILNADRNKLVANVAYHLVPTDQRGGYLWISPASITVVVNPS